MAKKNDKNDIKLCYRNGRVVAKINGREMSARAATILFPKHAQVINDYSHRAKKIDNLQKDFINHAFVVDEQSGNALITETVCLDNQVFSNTHPVDKQAPAWFEEKIELFMSKHNLHIYERQEAGPLYYIDGELVGEKYFFSLINFLDCFEPDKNDLGAKTTDKQK